jgi:hypothetical protein
VHIAVVSTRQSAAMTRATVRRAIAAPAEAEPYPAGGVWADPDLDAAARLMRSVIDEPEIALARGARAAADIATMHSAAVAGQQIKARLDEIAPQRRACSRLTATARLRRAAQQVRGRAE